MITFILQAGVAYSFVDVPLKAKHNLVVSFSLGTRDKCKELFFLIDSVTVDCFVLKMIMNKQENLPTQFKQIYTTYLYLTYFSLLTLVKKIPSITFLNFVLDSSEYV